jgi:hypothetical protein
MGKWKGGLSWRNIQGIHETTTIPKKGNEKGDVRKLPYLRRAEVVEPGRKGGQRGRGFMVK